MKYRKFGRTGLEVSELVFGGGKVGGVLIYADDGFRTGFVRSNPSSRHSGRGWECLKLTPSGHRAVK